MDMLVAEDDVFAAGMLKATLVGLGHEVHVCGNGLEALDILSENSISVLLSDWDMPGLDGMELTRKIRSRRADHYTYIILFTGMAGRANYAKAMKSGVEDFLSKPIDLVQLNMRLRVAERILSFRADYDSLKSIIPICSYCKSIRKDDDYWERVEVYLEENLEKDVSHGICPSCFQSEVIPQVEELEKRKKQK